MRAAAEGHRAASSGREGLVCLRGSLLYTSERARLSSSLSGPYGECTRTPSSAASRVPFLFPPPFHGRRRGRSLTGTGRDPAQAVALLVLDPLHVESPGGALFLLASPPESPRGSSQCDSEGLTGTPGPTSTLGCRKPPPCLRSSRSPGGGGHSRGSPLRSVALLPGKGLEGGGLSAGLAWTRKAPTCRRFPGSESRSTRWAYSGVDTLRAVL